MHQIKGFYNADNQINNTPNVTAMFGELSAKARTYALDIKDYFNPTFPNVKFTLFSSKVDNEEVSLDTNARDTIINIGEWLYSLGDAIGTNTTTANLATLAMNSFTAKITEIKVGPIVYDTIKRLPEWVSFKLRNTARETEVKVWLRDSAFRKDYDGYKIKIVPPFENINQFFMPVADLKELISKANPIELADRIDDLKGEYPATIVRVEATTYINPNNITDTIIVYWHAIIYGNAGDDSSLIRQAIIEYIANNSNSSEAEWKTILPDLFNTTAFYILPRWDKYAIPTRRTIPGIYSPIAQYKEINDFVKQKLNGLIGAAHIDQNLEVTTHRFKSLTLAMVGGEENRRGLFKVSDYFSDYIGEESSNEDFNRQKEATKIWTNLVTELLIKAENYESNPILPANTRLVSRNNLNFLVRKLDNVEYFIALKSNYSN